VGASGEARKGDDKMMKAALASVAIAAVAALSTPAKAAVAAVEETYTFIGACTDCYNGGGDIHATLVLEDYTKAVRSRRATSSRFPTQVAI